jgi:hypothetical protein
MWVPPVPAGQVEGAGDEPQEDHCRIAGTGNRGALVGGAGIASAVTGQGGALAVDPVGRTAATATMPCWGEESAPAGRGAYGQGIAVEASAKYLGLTQAQLRTRLQAGTSLAEVATAQGKSVTGLKDAIVAAVQARLQADTRLTTEQRNTLLARLRERLDAFVSATHQPGAGMGLHLGPAGDVGGVGPGLGLGPGNGMGAGMGR